MRNVVLAITAALVLAAGTAPSLADSAGSSNILAQCANILANPTAYRASLVAYCHNRQKGHNPSAVRAAPTIRDDGPTIALPG